MGYAVNKFGLPMKAFVSNEGFDARPLIPILMLLLECPQTLARWLV